MKPKQYARKRARIEQERWDLPWEEARRRAGREVAGQNGHLRET